MKQAALHQAPVAQPGLTPAAGEQLCLQDHAINAAAQQREHRVLLEDPLGEQQPDNSSLFNTLMTRISAPIPKSLPERFGLMNTADCNHSTKDPIAGQVLEAAVAQWCAEIHAGLRHQICFEKSRGFNIGGQGDKWPYRMRQQSKLSGCDHHSVPVLQLTAKASNQILGSTEPVPPDARVHISSYPVRAKSFALRVVLPATTQGVFIRTGGKASEAVAER